MVIRVMSDTEALQVGVFIGARGEVLVPGRSTSMPTVELEDAEGQIVSARLVGRLPGWPLLLGTVGETRMAPRPRTAFPAPEERVVRVGWGQTGPEPALGTVNAVPDDRGRARVDVPGQMGAPVFDGQGRLVGVTLDTRRRRSRLAPMSLLVPLLRTMVGG